jgi:NADPH-dependent 2,4-dienoyl-CoA reductase/sulfur reductase-like enzyme
MRVVVVGAGPAGVRAVEQLLRAGIEPVWIEEAPDGGGRIYERPPQDFRRTYRELYGADARRAQELHAVLDALKPRADWRPETLVWNIRPGDGVLDTLTRGTQRGEVHYDALILCTGAMDRVVPLPGWTRPGVTTLGGAQIALKAQGVAIGGRPVFVGSGPLLWLVALQYARAGAPPALVLDTTSFASKAAAAAGMLWNPPTFMRGLHYVAALRARRVPIAEGVTPLAIEGEGVADALRWRNAGGREQVTPCDAVALGWGLKPEAQLADLAGVPFRFDEIGHNWVPERDAAGRTPLRGVYLAGDGAGIGGAEVAEISGARAALALLEDQRVAVDHALRVHLDRRLRSEARFRAALERAFPYPAHLARHMSDETLLCRCEAITAGELRAAAERGPEVNRAKALSRVGMGRCQGRVCGPPAAEVLAEALGLPVAEVGRLRGQLPVKPIPLARASGCARRMC